MKALDLWMNGLHVGRWERSRSGHDRLVYARSWLEAPEGRPLSLSLPFTREVHGDGMALRGPAVAAYFENLIPDNERILLRLRDRFGLSGTGAFELLGAIGRDCAGALQLVAAGEPPGDARRIDVEPLDATGVARVLRGTTIDRRLQHDDTDAFRLSIAGAQEKTALTRHEGRWCIPRHATPSTHIFKLPLGIVGNMRADLRHSVELEWLCMELAREYGLPVAQVEIGRFEDQVVLIVERFDRRLSEDGRWWLRLPQEDGCQAFGMPPSRKYESDGGPGIRAFMDLLRGSDRSVQDRTTFFMAQLVFWIMGATDGHAKNFSLALLPGGRYRLTPLYDILSTYPIQGRGAGQLDPHRATLAMAVESRNRHYVLHDIHRWHWVAMARRLGLEADASTLLDTLVAQTPDVIDRVAARLPPQFPAEVLEAVRAGMFTAARRLASEPDVRV